jgi:hypothetical protein
MDRDPYSLTLKIGVGVVINNLDFTYLTLSDSTFTPSGSANPTLTTCTSTRRANRAREPGALTEEKLGAERRGQ